MKEPLSWYIAGPLIGLIVPLLILVREKQFGVSSSYRYLGALVFPKWSYFNYPKEQDGWQVQFAVGLIIAGITAAFLYDDRVVLSADAANYERIAVTVYDVKNWAQFLLGGFLVGFGARYANGCTAGHCIMGMAQLSAASFVATCAFFIGGLIASNWIVELLFHAG